jgi:hypothetical protein
LDGPSIPPLALSIELDPAPESRLKDFRNWQLALTVPKAPDTHGSISIDCGLGAPRTISLTKLSLGPQTYPASVEAADFGQVWISPEVRPRYRASIEPRIPGLDRTLVNVFVHTKEKQKPLANSLAWGGSYYLVWHESLALNIPQSVSSSPLAKRGDWACYLVALPDEDDEDIRHWIERTCCLTISRTRRSWALIHPPFTDLDSLGSRSVSSTTNLLLAVHSPHDPTIDSGTLTCSVGSTSDSVANIAGTHFFEIHHDNNSNTPVALTWDDFALHEITKADAQNFRDSLGVGFVFRSRIGTERHEAFLHQIHFEQLLQRVRGLELDIFAITLPHGTHGRLRSRMSAGSDWRTITLPADPNIQEASKSDLIREINAVLQDASLDISFDFGAFGGCYLARSIHEAHDSLSQRIHHSVRDRIIWFCIAAQSYHTVQRRPFAALDDGALLRHFEHVPTPTSLIAHRRHLDRLLDDAKYRGTRT